jgi:hypothetical protein
VSDAAMCAESYEAVLCTDSVNGNRIKKMCPLMCGLCTEIADSLTQPYLLETTTTPKATTTESPTAIPISSDSTTGLSTTVPSQTAYESAKVAVQSPTNLTDITKNDGSQLKSSDTGVIVLGVMLGIVFVGFARWNWKQKMVIDELQDGRAHEGRERTRTLRMTQNAMASSNEIRRPRTAVRTPRESAYVLPNASKPTAHDQEKQTITDDLYLMPEMPDGLSPAYEYGFSA